jgi:group I intron endonuclease
MGVVYQHRRNDTNEIFYVGIGRDNKRPHSKSRRNIIWKNIVNKHGYTVEILHEDLSFDECKEIERELISIHGRKDLGTGILCNLTDGGDGVVGYIHSDVSKRNMSESKLNMSDETKRRMSDSKTGEKNHFYGKTHSEETKIKMIDSKTGEKNHFYGKTHSEETKRRMSEVSKGKKLSDETKRKMTESKLNMSDETKRKMGESRKGEKNPMFGKKRSEETKRKMRETRRKNKESLDN